MTAAASLPSTSEEIEVAMDWAASKGMLGYLVDPGQTVIIRTPMLYYAGVADRVGPLGVELRDAEIVYDVGPATNVPARSWASAEKHDGVIRVPWSGMLCAEQISPAPANYQPVTERPLGYLAEPGELIILRTPMLYYTGRVERTGPMCIQLGTRPNANELKIVYDVGEAVRITEQNWKNANPHVGPMRIGWHSALSIEVIREGA